MAKQSQNGGNTKQDTDRYRDRQAGKQLDIISNFKAFVKISYLMNAFIWFDIVTLLI